MAQSTHELIQAFGGVEDDQRYTRLVENFVDDAVYYDPFFGAQIGKPAIQSFMEHMEELVPKSGAGFSNWQTTAGVHCGYAQWTMVATAAAGHQVAVPGESLYRMRDGLVLGVVDYVDPVAYAKLRGDSARTPDFVAGGAVLPQAGTAQGLIADELQAHIEAMGYAGRWAGSAELIDHEGDGGYDDGVGWAQWMFHGPHGDFAGWSLRRPGGKIRDFFDTVTAHQLSSEPTRN